LEKDAEESFEMGESPQVTRQSAPPYFVELLARMLPYRYRMDTNILNVKWDTDLTDQH